MKKTERAWAVVWTEKAGNEYDVPEHSRIIVDELAQSTKVRCKCKEHRGWHWIGAKVLFETREEAVAYNKGNTDFVVIPCTITYSLPTKKGKKKRA